MKRANGKNQQGSVMLAVVCMGIMCITMATIALSLVNYTNASTARNVMRTHAKVTAESCLAEFIGSYDTGNQDDCAKLQALSVGYTKASPRVIKVNPGNNTFRQNYGDAEIQIYSEGTGFKVASSCTFGGDPSGNNYITPQTQTASVMFAYAMTVPQITSSALECSEGITTGAGQQMDAEGDIVIEKDPAGPIDKLIKVGVNSGNFRSHIYSEYSLAPSNGGKFRDVYNKTGTMNYEPNKSSIPKTGNYFYQAPVMWTDGYLGLTDNTASIKTEVGKTDVNGWSAKEFPTDTTVRTQYDKDHLSNKDGFIYVKKQVMLTGSESDKFDIGDTGYPIDVYCRGFYYGAVNSYSDYDGSHELNMHWNAAKDIKDESGKSLVSVGGGSSSKTIHGNVYCYSDGSTNNDFNKSGSLWLFTSNDKTLTIDGDLYVENDIVIRKEAKLEVTGTLHCKGSIYVVDFNGSNGDTLTANKNDVADISGDKIVNGSSSREAYRVNSYLDGTNTIDCPTKITAAHYDKNVDKDGAYAERDKLPTDGYNAATGVSSATRTTLKSTFDAASTNTIFRASADPSDPHHAYAKDIAEKYAQALATPISDKFRDEVPFGSNSANADYYKKFADQKYKNSAGQTKTLVSIHGNNAGNFEDVTKNIYEIHSSCRFTSVKQFQQSNDSTHFVHYVVKLTDQNIVIALPYLGSGDDQAISSVFYIDSTERVGESFVYFMYYDLKNTSCRISESASAKTITVPSCMYLSGTGNVSVNLTKVYRDGGFVRRTVTFTPSSESYRQGLFIHQNSKEANSGHYVMDLDLLSPYNTEETFNEEKIINCYKKSNAPVSVTDPNVYSAIATDNVNIVYGHVTEPGAYYQNYILFLIPDDASWGVMRGTRLQGIIYAPKGTVDMGSDNNSRIYGKVKCKKFITHMEAAGLYVVEIPEAKGSILDFLGASNSSVSEIQLQYYEY